MLSFIGPASFHFVESGTPTDYWLLYESTDGGVTYYQVDSNPYGTDSGYMPPGPGTHYYGVGSDDGITPTGTESNVVIT